MSAAFTRLKRWLWTGKDKEPINQWELALTEMENVRFHSLVQGSIMASSRKKIEEMRIDKEHDAVLVPSDSDSDWSIGWVEPCRFQSDDAADNSFAVLVPCYRHDDHHQCKQLKSRPDNLMFIGSINDNRKSVEQWISSLQQ